MNKHIKQLYPYLAGAFIFMLFVLYNGYPMLNPDSGAYIKSGFLAYVPSERPIFYGLFIAASSFGISAWFTVFVQCLILSYVCIMFIRSLLPNLPDAHLFGLLLIVSMGTIAGWYAGQMLPDVFTPVLFLSSYVYLRGQHNIRHRLLLLGITFLCLLTHYSHLMIATLFPVVLFIASFIFKEHLQVLRKKMIVLFALAMLGWFGMFSTNYVADNGFVSSKSSHVFMMGKLAESGILKSYLKKYCSENNYKICEYKDNLPYVAWEFVWDWENSPVYKTGGWDANKAEYKAIINDILSKPEYWPMLVFKSIEATLRQVISLNIDEGEELAWERVEKDDYLYTIIDEYFPDEINQFMFSKQSKKILNISFYDEVYAVLLFLTTLFMLFITDKETKKKAITVYAILILYLLLNAFVTATFANVLTRLNSRTIWLLPMVNCIFIYYFFSTNKRLLLKKNR